MKRLPAILAAIILGITAAIPAALSSLTDAYNNSGTVYCSFCWTISGSSYASGTRLIDFNVAGFDTFGVDPDSAIYVYAPISNTVQIKLRGTPVLSGNGTSFAVASSQLTFGANGNPSLDKASVTGAGIGSASGCGSSPTLSTNATDFMGSIVTGSGAGTCTINFSGTKSAAPNCIVQDQTDATVPAGIAPTTTALVFTAVAAKTYVWLCNDKA